MKLNHQTSIITGGAKGIGAGIARAFAQEGATVVIADTDEAAGTKLVAEIGAGAHFFRCDVSASSDVQAKRSFAATAPHGLKATPRRSR